MMQYDAKMDVMDTSDQSWFELFIDPNKARKFLADTQNKKYLPKLCIQFTEKGFLAEREKDKYAKMDIEEINLYERKAASMRLCAMATLAALNWDFDYIIDNISRYELLTLRVLADHTYRVYNEKNLDATFGNWLFYRFVIAIDRRNILPPPAPKSTIPTMYNQIAAHDMALIRHEKVQRMIAELREHLTKARTFITEMINEPRDLIAPGIECFLKPFAKLAPKALSRALIGDRDVLVECPQCDFEIEKILLPAAEVANKCRADLVAILFAMGKLKDARKILKKVHKSRSDLPITYVDDKMIEAFRCMLNLSPLPPDKMQQHDAKNLEDDTSLYRRSELMRARAEDETSGQLKMLIEAENAARSLIDGIADCVREKVASSATAERFVKALRRQIDSAMRDRDRRAHIIGTLQFLCATTANLRDLLERAGIDVTKLRSVAKPTESKEVLPPPTNDEINDILKSLDDPYWTILTQFDLGVIKEAMSKIEGFTFPETMRHSEFLDEIVVSTKNSPNHLLQRLLLAKLEQLARIRNMKAFTQRLQEYFAEMSGSSQWILLATYESIHVHATIGNQVCFLPYERKLHDFSVSQTVLIFKPEFKPTENSAKMINQCLALLLNLGEFKTVLEKGGQIPIEQFPCVPLARLLGAYAQNINDKDMAQKCADGICRTNKPKFVTASLMKKDEPLATKRDIENMMHLFGLIRHPQLIEFILSYTTSLYNQLLVIQKKAHLKVHAKLLGLFAFNETMQIDLKHADDIRQCMREVTQNAYKYMRFDVDTIRTYADWLYAEEDLQAAGRKYLECVALQAKGLRLKAPLEMVLPNTTIRRLRVILADAGYLTMSLLMCQYIKNGGREETLKAMQESMNLLENNVTRDIGPALSTFITDVDLIEMLSSHYSSMKMKKAINTLYAGASTMAANKNVPAAMNGQEVLRRSSKFIQTLAAMLFAINV